MSVKADAVGVTKNLSLSLKDYADSLGKTTDDLTKAERAQAIFVDWMRETKAVAGNAAEYANTLAGAQAKQEAQALKLAQAYGETVAPSVQLVTETSTAFLKTITEFVRENETLVQGVTIGIGSYSGLVAVLGGDLSR